MKACFRRILPAAAVLIGFGLLCLALNAFVFHTVRIEGASMEDTLSGGDIVLVTRFDYRFGGEPERGDIIECSFPGRSGTYVKRVIGLPGDHVEILDSRTYINAVPLSEPYATGPSEDYSVLLGPDEYLVLGDNRAESYDSRAEDMGFLHRENLLGRVRIVLHPFRKIK